MAARRPEERPRGRLAAELGHVDVVQFLRAAVDLLGEDLRQVRLADAGRARETEYGDGLVWTLGGHAPVQTHDDRVDHGVLADDLGFQVARQLGRIDDGEIAALCVPLVGEHGEIGQPIERILARSPPAFHRVA